MPEPVVTKKPSKAKAKAKAEAEAGAAKGGRGKGGRGKGGDQKPGPQKFKEKLCKFVKDPNLGPCPKGSKACPYNHNKRLFDKDGKYIGRQKRTRGGKEARTCRSR